MKAVAVAVVALSITVAKSMAKVALITLSQDVVVNPTVRKNAKKHDDINHHVFVRTLQSVFISTYNDFAGVKGA